MLEKKGSLLYGNNGNILTDSNDLICCSGYGEPNRNSDPTIGSSVNAQARAGNWVSLRDPVGLYISRIDDSPYLIFFLATVCNFKSQMDPPYLIFFLATGQY
jgi:hypothetical protein